jgi:hypothetical protein
MYPIDVPHLEKFCTSHVPHLELFVPHSRPYQMATLVKSIQISHICLLLRLWIFGNTLIVMCILGSILFLIGSTIAISLIHINLSELFGLSITHKHSCL